MREIDYFFLGYIEIKAEPTDVAMITSLFLRHGIRSRCREDGRIVFFYDRKSDVERLLNKAQIGYTITRDFRIFGTDYTFTERLAAILTLFVTVVMVIFLSGLVWRVEVDGNENISDADIISELEECGLYVGKRWRKLDRGALEGMILGRRRDIAWININRSGTVAYVSVIEAETVDIEDTEAVKYSNIVATEDSVIEYIGVESGVAVVKAGDVVKKGDLLIMGVNSNDGSGEACAARGTVIGRANKTIVVKIPRERTEKKTDKMSILSVRIKLFNFSINIFKKYRNLGAECDIIEEINKISLFSVHELPVEIIKEYEISYRDVSYAASDEELVLWASYRMRAMLEDALGNLQLNSIKTRGQFTDEGYVMVSEIVYSGEISESVEYTVE